LWKPYKPHDLMNRQSNIGKKKISLRLTINLKTVPDQHVFIKRSGLETQNEKFTI
jgi:hypothetical protein